MIESNMNNWMAIPLHYLRHVGGTLVFECDYAISMVEISGLPPFCYEVLVAWSQVQTLNSANSNVRKTDIILWNNKHITVAGRSVYYHNWHQVGIKRIKDLLNENNQFLSYGLFCEKFNLNTPFTLYHGLVAAIPKLIWKRDLKNVSPSISENQTCTLLRARPI